MSFGTLTEPPPTAMADLPPYPCSDAMLLPLFYEGTWSRGFRAFLYLTGLLYSFMGVAIAAEVFMVAIETITSKTKRVAIKEDEAGTLGDDVSIQSADTEAPYGYREIEVWNPTVANLSLMALGSSAPEILLACIEIIGALGPGTIVGSAAFNLLCISAVCVMSIPSPGVRRIKAFNVFLITAFSSVFAYLWLIIILVASSPGQVEIWEGLVTLLMFPVLLVAAYIADRNLLCGGLKKKRAENGDDRELGKLTGLTDEETNPSFRKRSQFANIEKEVSKQFPYLSPEDKARIVAARIRDSKPKSRLAYRIRATKWMNGERHSFVPDVADHIPALKRSASGRYVPADGSLSRNQSMESLNRSVASQAAKARTPRTTIVEFTASVYAFSDVSNTLKLKIRRHGRLQKQTNVRYETASGAAKKGEHFLPKTEVVIFQPKEDEKEVLIDLVPGAEWKAQQGFFVFLHLEDADKKTEVGTCNPATVRFNDSKEIPTFEFERSNVATKESIGVARIPVLRTKGDVSAPATIRWSTQDQTAQEGSDYLGKEGELYFKPHEVQKFIDIEIVDDEEEEKTETFGIRLDSVSQGCDMGFRRDAVITIVSDDSVREMFMQMDKMIPQILQSLEPGKRSWRKQFIEATSVNAGNTADADARDVLTHVLSFPWKVIFALVPPPSYCGGWLTFFVALAMIGGLTAIVGDLAGIFGCLVGLKPSVTSITFVALGTSLPDLFASRLAAVQEDTADNSIGNVTGSNSVNVFLGLGLPWFIAAVYHEVKKTPGGFSVPAGDLGFSVAVFTSLAIVTLLLLIVRRFVGFFGKGELGGPMIPKMGTGVFMISLWFLYVLLSALQAYGYIESF